MTEKKPDTAVTTNRKAYHDYFVEETFEAGIALQGTEVKSLRSGLANLTDSYAIVKNNEVFLFNANISAYPYGNIMNHEPLRTRKLLFHKEEIRKLVGKITQKGFTLIPLKIYFVRGKAKVLIGLAKGKKAFDKRETIKEKESKREVERTVKGRNR
ncbi:MAG: SsrA-binding protein [Nitrospirae bacterium GWD2_57_9]|nr:MAG: SsrA-binding protein [Nitrospirae bacterium GWD2_57_9]OGW45145.1 MAG: SsrA-binding protein [Nitrospirae bacterium GWC2_57_9]